MFTREECEYLLKLLADDGFSDWTPESDVRKSVREKLRAIIENAPPLAS